MNDNNALLSQYELLIEVTHQILNLDFEQESFIECIDSLQMKQKQLREQIDEMWKHAPSTVRESVRPSILECIELEQKAIEKLKQYQSFIDKAIQEMKGLETARNNYLKVYSQTGGYFLDQHQ
ncbi:hypothetical protein [Ferviditalea candida]|uniref:Flagellar protein FliT n=1 Tax=Ferviditalea candida TaxID=3108399 RepID=A0ABU5ZIN8_9BACL|nr:hypothetical protein [Paenibacillaceae bacterium T2]